MGASSWADHAYSAKLCARSASKTGGFDYDHTVKTAAATTGAKMTPHKALDPINAKLRESRDSTAHPNSLAITVFMDVTGSMAETPKIMVNNLKTLMSLLVKRGYVADPQLMFNAIGDCYSDNVPVQISQWESGVEMDDHLEKLVLEGGGGGTREESYDLGLYFMARHTAIDCWEKRGKKGYIFLVGDEGPYKSVDKHKVKEIFGDTIQDDIPIEDIINEVKERYEIFMIRPDGTSNFSGKDIRKRWQDLLGKDHVIEIQSVNVLPETIAGIIGTTEGAVDVDELAEDLKNEGCDAADSITKAITPYANNKVAKKGATVEGSLPAVAGGSTISTI